MNKTLVSIGEKKIITKIILVMVILLSIRSPCFAETIFLKSGQIIEGKIIERAEDYVKIDLGGVSVPYFMEDIKSIEEKKVISPTDTKETIQNAYPNFKDENIVYNQVNQSSYNYFNRKYGFKLWYPPTWYLCDTYSNRDVFEQVKIQMPSDIDGELVCAIIAGGNDGTEAVVMIIAKRIEKIFDENATLDLVKQQVKNIPFSFGSKLIERPNIINIEGRNFVRYIGTTYVSSGKKMKNVYYHIASNTDLYTIATTAQEKNYDVYDRDFKEIIKSFTIF